MSTEYAIETRSLTKRYGRKEAVSGLNLQVPRGSVFAFLGRNGAGKTSTVRMLLNLLDRTSGEVSVLGLDPAHRDTEIKRRVGYVAENQRMYDWMTVSQIAWFCSGFYPTWDKAYCTDLMKQMGLNPNDKIKSLSMGTKAKVALLLAMAHRPELLILDEPTSGLDVPTARTIEQCIVDAKTRGKCIVYSTHVMEEAEYLCDRIAVISDGSLKITGTMQQLREATGKQRLREIFLGLLGME